MLVSQLPSRTMDPRRYDFARSPMLVYWEMTQACALACRHCRAEAVPLPHPQELTFEEGTSFLRQILEFGDPLPQLITKPMSILRQARRQTFWVHLCGNEGRAGRVPGFDQGRGQRIRIGDDLDRLKAHRPRQLVIVPPI